MSVSRTAKPPVVQGLILLLLASLVFGLRCRDPQQGEAHPFIVIGIDGGEWGVIEELWSQGKLPTLRSLKEEGTAATLETAYVMSPVIWTTIATGVAPWAHGIRDFVVPTAQGDVPVSSTVRKVPALWNMLSSVGRRVAVLGWWATWPVEEINGVMISDRALEDINDRVWPREYVPHFEQGVAEAGGEETLFHGTESAERRDRAIAYFAGQLAAEGFDLLLVYFRSPDIVSHFYWKYFEPARFPDVEEKEIAEKGERIPQVYEAVDRAIGRIRAAAPEESNFIVLSDHGFRAAQTEEVTVLLDLDAVLARLGYLTRGDHGVDLARTRVYTYASRPGRKPKMVRFSLAGREPGGTVRPAERHEIRRQLEADLHSVTFASGRPAFRVRDPGRWEKRDGADFVVEVLTDGVTTELLIGAESFSGAISQIAHLSGTHTKTSHGIFLAAGPDIDPDADLSGLRIHDIAPTLLYGLGLPVAEDFVGRPRIELYSEAVRRGRPVATIASWGARGEGSVTTSEVDDKILDELRALGYLQ